MNKKWRDWVCDQSSSYLISQMDVTSSEVGTAYLSSAVEETFEGTLALFAVSIVKDDVRF